MNRRTLLIALGLATLGIGWYLFRPERLFIDDRVNESFPAAQAAAGEAAKAEAEPLLTGQFHDGAHAGKGTATIYRLADGKRVLRLTAFETSNGPDLQVHLVAAKDAADSEAVKKAGFVSLGALKGNIGDQNYDVPADVDLSKYMAVTIWCRRFGVNFTTAPLGPKA